MQPNKSGTIKHLVLGSFLVLLVSVSSTSAQSVDAELIREAALDYIEGFYEGNAERMERALHPELAKRIVHTGTNGKSSLSQMGALTLVQSTRARRGKPESKEKQQKDVSILDIFGNTASVKVTATDWIDYMHLAKWNGRWVVVNVLWELKLQNNRAQNSPR